MAATTTLETNSAAQRRLANRELPLVNADPADLRSVLRIIENVGHCPHLSSPGPSAAAMNAFFAKEKV